jgi:excisionase family DNA binding protein
MIGVGRSTVYDLIKDGRLKAFKFGRLRRVERTEAERVARTLSEG